MVGCIGKNMNLCTLQSYTSPVHRLSEPIEGRNSLIWHRPGVTSGLQQFTSLRLPQVLIYQLSQREGWTDEWTAYQLHGPGLKPWAWVVVVKNTTPNQSMNEGIFWLVHHHTHRATPNLGVPQVSLHAGSFPIPSTESPHYMILQFILCSQIWF